ncbi:MAG: NACHT domain-containing protein [Egibacteraceae bacterium]
MAGDYALRRQQQERPLLVQPDPDLEQRNRSQMLERVRIAWIKGVLEDSLDTITRIELGLERRPEAVRHPAALVAQWPTGQTRTLPAGISIDVVFDELGGGLLILGAPGSGKTTLLLELTRALLDRAAKDPNHPIPVVFNLTSWATGRSPLAEWLVGELVDRYQIPRKLAQGWVDAEQVLPLLDGLDEVAAAYRQECVKAINVFRAEHGLLQMVVCSRTEEYEQLLARQKQLRLLGAVAIQPLTRGQVAEYLQQAGEPLAGVRAAVCDDETLWELLTTPLLLNIAALAYRGKSAAAVRGPGTFAERRAHLFAAYNEAMFERRTPLALYPPEQTLRWLAWLAETMQRHDQSVFHLELMQPDWLPTPAQQRIVTRGTASIVGLFAGLGTGLAAGVGAWVAEGVYPGTPPRFTWLSEQALTGLAYGLGAALAAGLIIGFSAYEKRIQPAERLSWSWAQARVRLGAGLAYGLFGGLGAGLAFGSTFTWVAGLGAGLAVGLAGGLATVLAGGLSGRMSAARTTPNQGIRTSARNAIGVGLAGGLLVGPVAGALFGVAFTRVVVGLSIGVAFGLSFGLVVGLRQGGGAALRHLALRILLVRNGSAPWRYINFLEYATERIFLRKAGGGYVFVHRLLREYFAALELSSAAR